MSGVILMPGLVPFIACLLLCGCRKRDAHPPMLHLAFHGTNSNSVGTFRIAHIGPVTKSGSGKSAAGAAMGHSVTVEKIADDGLTLTVVVSDSSAQNSKTQVLVPYDRKIVVPLTKDTTLTAHLERKN
jgi:hypothetical protein